MKGVRYDLELLITCLMLMVAHRNISERVTMGKKALQMIMVIIIAAGCWRGYESTPC